MFSGFLRNALMRNPMVRSNFKTLTAARTYAENCFERGDCIEVSNETEFDKLMKECDKPVLVSFYANWCINCDCMQIGVVEQIVKKKGGAIRMAKVDVDQCTDLAVKYMVKGLPQLLVFVNGEEIRNRLVGLQPPSRIEEVVDKAISDHKKNAENK